MTSNLVHCHPTDTVLARVMSNQDTPDGPQQGEAVQFSVDANKPAPALTNNRKDRQHHALALHGNYWNYYFHRTAAVPDARLSLLPPEIFTNKTVLDLGCNAGKLTAEVCIHLGATKALGIDIDDVLVKKAEEYCRDAFKNVSTTIGACEFVCDDFMKAGYWDDFLSSHDMYDTILLFSITKWLHLHHGDAGLVELFGNLFKVLPPGGTLVIEPQEWQNYKRAVSKNTTLRPMYKGLKMKPNFELQLEEVGFELSVVIEREEGGFSRPLMVWKKPSRLG